ncbi:hypothetical protein ACLMJK_008173 [Lecanora helva]
MPPKGKKRPAEAEEYESDDGFVEDAPKGKKTKKVAGGEAAGKRSVGRDGEVFWELSGKRRVGVSEFKGNTMVNIREFYEKEGEMLPGKKGISLPIEQFNSIINLLPQIEKALGEKGHKISRPNYDGDEAAEQIREPEPKENAKKNFEATSDEE